MSLYILGNAVLTATKGIEALKQANWVSVIVIALVIGLIIGLIRTFSLKGQLTSVYKNDTAVDYTRDKSFVVDEKRDLFLYSKTTKEEKPQNEGQKQ